MRCKRCGGLIDSALGECLQCGMRPPKEHTPYIRSMEEIAREYCTPEEDTSTALPELFRDYQGNQTRFSKALETSVDNAHKDPIKGNPVIGLDEYVRLLGVEDGDEIELPEEPAVRETQSRTVQMPEPEQELNPILKKIDNIIEKPADRVLEYIHEKFPQPTRAKKSAVQERLMLLAGTLCAVILITVLTVVIILSIAPDVSGEWLVTETAAGERLTVEFTDSGDVTARIYINGEENVYLTGEYKVRRSNGSNLLTINYDDGSEKRLYYIIEKDSGTFTNVDSNKSDTYIRID